MIVTCPGCATAFVLDDALVPPAGAPVQCSRCNQLFTATLPRRDVMIFGSESYRSAEGRQVFGAPVVLSPSGRLLFHGLGPSNAAAPRRVWRPGHWPRPPSVPSDARAAMFARAAERPDDDAGLLVLSDSLMELGEPQGRLMAFQLEEERGSELMRKVKINVLLRDHAKHWHPPGARNGTFRRGLLDHVEWFGETDPDHAAWRSVRSLHCRLERVPSASFFDVERPLLEKVTGLNWEFLTHVLEARPLALHELEGETTPEAVHLELRPALQRLTRLRRLTLRTWQGLRDVRLSSAWLAETLGQFGHLERLRLNLPAIGLDEVVRLWRRLAPTLDLQIIVPYPGVDGNEERLHLKPHSGEILFPSTLSAVSHLEWEYVRELGAQLGREVRLVEELSGP